MFGIIFAVVAASIVTWVLILFKDSVDKEKAKSDYLSSLSPEERGRIADETARKQLAEIVKQIERKPIPLDEIDKIREENKKFLSEKKDKK